jgi:cyclopropane-fatty-acyl-phospholipid synthase
MKTFLAPSAFLHRFEVRIVCDLLRKAGICVNGPEPWDILVNDDRFYNYVFRNGSLGLGETYMTGMWDCKSLDSTLAKLLSANLESYSFNGFEAMLTQLKALLFNGQSIGRSLRDIHHHYDLGNDLFEAMLDERMIYSCAYWKDAQTLEEAQVNKLDLICRKMYLEKGMRVLDLGCGWGGLAAFAAEKYKVEVVGVTLSAEQVAIARQHYQHLPVEFLLQDYRSLEGKFDRVISVGMMEHVGYRNYTDYLEKVQQVLKDDGLFLLHTIGSETSVRHTDPWINRYIFPNGMMPSANQITKAVEHRLVMEDWHIFGDDYDRTLMEWRRRFKLAWPNLRDKYGNHFYRMWDYYLCCSAASFRVKKNRLWQVVFSKPGRQRFYNPVR